MNPLETYLREVWDIRSTGAAVAETSYYPPLRTLLNAIGATLQPQVRCVIHLANRGAGIPDGGLFTPDQFQKVADGQPLPGQLPARGAIEVKSPRDDVAKIARDEQVARYAQGYGQVLVTNLREFVLVGQDAFGQPVTLESYRLAASEAEFWQLVALPSAAARQHGEAFADFLRRVMLHAAPLTTPKDVAWFLASYAREALRRIEHTKLDALDTLRVALEQALGLTFQDERGDHFFRSTLVQTLFYGAFSGWVLWSKDRPIAHRGHYDWKDAGWELNVPMIRALFHQLTDPSRLAPLGLVEVLDWTGTVLNRVDRAAFFESFDEGQAVQYFYEPFLQAFDPELRKQLGVWYTPPEIVQYMVARVDTVLREELGIADGLADERVVVLDPATGTGSYVVEVLRKIAATLAEQGGDALAAHDVKRAALERVFGFEIMPAPFVVAHLQLGLLLNSLGAPLSDERHERAGVYLTNSLTGWDTPAATQKRLLFPELEQERDAAGHVKRDMPILVVIGNPPYNGYAGVALDEERDLTTAYRKAKHTRQPQGQGLNDLYVRFFRMAERKIVEGGGRGVVCYISNYSWLDGLSFTAMRERYLEVFDRIWIDNLNGDKYKTGKVTPWGDPDPSVFSTELNREGIQVGTAVALMVRRAEHQPAPAVHFRNLWGRTKRAVLLATAEQQNGLYETVSPPTELGLPFLTSTTGSDYFSWPLLPDLFPVSFPGVKTSRDDVVVDIDRDRLVRRMQQYFDPSISHEEMRRIASGAMDSTARFDATAVRDGLLKRGFLPEYVVRYCYRPFDVRWLYWEPETKLLDEKRSDYFSHVFEGNLTLVSQQKPRREWSVPQAIRSIGCLDLMDRGATCIPMHLKSSAAQTSLFQGDAAEFRANTTGSVESYLRGQDTSADDLFHHVVAMLHSPLYRTENGGALRQYWPRIPLPATRESLEASAALGRQVVALLDSERPLLGVTTGPIPPLLRAIGRIASADGKPLDPTAGDLALTVNWGYAGQRGVTMPGRGKSVAREYTPEERAALALAAAERGLDVEGVQSLLGETTLDVYLNERAYWSNVPKRVWEYTIGGYQVIKKWLSYREQDLLGRPLSADEAREVMHIARRIAALLLLEPELDANYATVKAAAYPWPKSAAAEERTATRGHPYD